MIQCMNFAKSDLRVKYWCLKYQRNNWRIVLIKCSGMHSFHQFSPLCSSEPIQILDATVLWPNVWGFWDSQSRFVSSEKVLWLTQFHHLLRCSRWLTGTCGSLFDDKQPSNAGRNKPSLAITYWISRISRRLGKTQCHCNCPSQEHDVHDVHASWSWLNPWDWVNLNLAIDRWSSS